MSRDFLRPFGTWIALLGTVSASASAMLGCSPTRIFAQQAPDGGSEVVNDGGDAGRSSGGGNAQGGSMRNSAGAGADADAGAGGATGGDAGEPGSTGGGNTECTTADDCPGIDTECSQRTCTDGKCGLDQAKSGLELGAQTPGDCQRAICDGAGGVTTENDDTDKPDDGNACVTDTCQSGVPAHANAPNTTACGATLQFKCDGQGACGNCTKNSDCGVDNLCATYACTTGSCKTTFVPNGQGNLANTAKDCQKNVCNGTGSPITIADATDLPVDGVACTKDVCNSGVPSNPPEGTTTVCGMQSTCNGNGACVCNAPNPCTAGVCGTVTDGCGIARNCGNPCVAPQTCGGLSGSPNTCGCTPNPVCNDFCGGQVPDGCGHMHQCPGDDSVCNGGCGACTGACFAFDHCGCLGSACS